MTDLDLRVILDTLATLALIEVLVKPVVVYCGRWLLRKADIKVRWIPDWLYDNPPADD